MSSNVSNAFIQLWTSEAKAEYEQMTSRLRDAVRVVTGIQANQYNFPVFGHGEATRNKGRHEDLQPMNVSHSIATASLVPVHALEYVDDMDQLKTNQDLRAQYTQVVMGAIARELDDLIIDAMDTNANSALAVSNTLNKAGLIKATKTFHANEIPQDGAWYSAISPGALEDMLSDTDITNRDYVESQMLNEGMAKGVLGWNFVMSNRLPTPTAGKRTNFFWHKQAIGLAISKEPTLEVAYIPEKQSYAVIGKLQAGAVIIDGDGVQEAAIDD